MRLALILIHFLLISTAGLTVHSANVPDHVLYEERNSLRGWYNPASQTYWDSGMEGLDYFEDKWTNVADRHYYAIYPRAVLSISNGNKVLELANGPSLGYNHYNKVVSRTKDADYELDAKDQDDYTRLLLLCLGIVGIIGIRRTVKKISSAQKIRRGGR